MYRNMWYCMASTAMDVLDRAPDFGVDGLILEFDPSAELPSHGWWVFEDLATYEGAAGMAKTGEELDFALRLRASVNRIVEKAEGVGVQVYLMGPELTYSERVAEVHPELADPAQDFMYDFVRDRLLSVFDALPGVAGIKIYLDEGTANINDMESPVPPADRMYRMLCALLDACHRKDRTLIASTFTLMPHQMQAITDALKRIPPDPHLVVDNYACAGDWGRIAVPNPAIGDVGGHPEIISFDYCGEIWGQSVIPLCQAQFVQDSVRQAAASSKHLVGFAGYVTWHGNALGSLNESTVYAAGRIARGDTAGAEQMVHDWAAGRHGAGAGEPVAWALMQTREIILKSWHDFEFWVQELPKSELADLAWYNWSLHWESLAIWDESFREAERSLFFPREETVAAVVAEKDEAVRLALTALDRITEAEGALAKSDHDELHCYFGRLLTMCRVLRAYSEAFYRARMLHGGDATQEPHVRQLICGLRALADEIERDADPGFWVCTPERVRFCAQQIEGVASGQPWPEVGGYDFRVDSWNDQLRRWGYQVSSPK